MKCGVCNIKIGFLQWFMSNKLCEYCERARIAIYNEQWKKRNDEHTEEVNREVQERLNTKREVLKNWD